LKKHPPTSQNVVALSYYADVCQGCPFPLGGDVVEDPKRMRLPLDGLSCWMRSR